MKIKAGTRKNVAARAANIVAPRSETARGGGCPVEIINRAVGPSTGGKC